MGMGMEMGSYVVSLFSSVIMSDQEMMSTIRDAMSAAARTYGVCAREPVHRGSVFKYAISLASTAVRGGVSCAFKVDLFLLLK